MASPVDQYRAAPSGDSPTLSSADLPGSFDLQLAAIAQGDWWSASPSGTTAPAPLRAPADVIAGTLAARDAGAGDPARLLAVARRGGDYLLKAQREGGRGLFPFPDPAAKPGALFDAARRDLAQDPNRQRRIRSGWLVDDHGSGSLLFDNGLAGLAVLDLYAATREQKWLRSAEDAAAWAMNQPVVTNWNYNSFSIGFLARLSQITGKATYLDAAVRIADLGVIPGQLPNGPNEGRWLDSHNARGVYHWILVRNLTLLTAALPAGHAAFGRVRSSLTRALNVADRDIAAEGINAPDGALCALSAVAQLPVAAIPDVGQSNALRTVGQYAWGRQQAGSLGVKPGAWGEFLRTTTVRSR